MQQRSKEWFEARCGKFTASNFYKLIAGKKTAETYIFEKVVEEVYGLQEGFENDAMRWGTEFEPDAIEFYELLTGNKVEEIAFIEHSENVGGSPDGFIGENGAIEVKCPFNPINHIKHCLLNSAKDLEKLNKGYYWQCIGVLWLSGRQWIDFVSFDPRLDGARRMHVLRIERNENEIKKLLEALESAVKYKKELISNFEKLAQ